MRALHLRAQLRPQPLAHPRLHPQQSLRLSNLSAREPPLLGRISRMLYYANATTYDDHYYNNHNVRKSPKWVRY